MARLLIRTEEGKLKKLPRWKRFALKDSFTNSRCRICYDKLNTHADIVFGDPWGMSNVDWKNGMSLILTRTQPGDELINSVIEKGDAIINKALLSEVIKGQNIDKRKQSVAIALTVYKQKGWHLPTYTEKLRIADIGCNDKELQQQEQLISKFILDSKLSKDEIIKANLVMLRKQSPQKTKPYRAVISIIKCLKQIIK